MSFYVDKFGKDIKCVVEAVVDEPVLVVEDNPDDPKKPHMMINFVPNWKYDEDLLEAAGEFIFLIDRSGSMMGERINFCKKSLQLLLRAIPNKSKFNIVGFGSNFVKLFDKSVEYTNENVNKAQKHIEKLQADLGGTSLYPPLKSVLEEKRDRDLPRTIIVVTDGEFDSKLNVFNIVKLHKEECRVYALGISSGVDKNTLKTLVSLGNGECEFVLDSKNIETVTMKLFKNVLEPTYRDIDIKWPKSVMQVPYKIPAVFKNKRLLAFAIPTKKVDSFDDITISAHNPEGEKITFSIKNIRHVSGNIIKKLAGWNAIRDLEQETSQYHTEKYKKENPNFNEKVKEDIIRLSIDYQVLSKYTSYLAEEIREEEVVNTGMQIQILESSKNMDMSEESSIEETMKRSFKSKKSLMSKKTSVKKKKGKKMKKGKDMSVVKKKKVNEVQINKSEISEDVLDEMNDDDDECNDYDGDDVDEELEEKKVVQKDSEKEVKKESKKEDKKISKKDKKESITSPKSSSGKFEDIITCQKVDGSWSWKDVEKLLKLKLEDTNDILWITLVVIQFLEKNFSSSKDLWDLSAKKGVTFVKRECKKKNIDFEDLLTRAKKVLDA